MVLYLVRFPVGKVPAVLLKTWGGFSVLFSVFSVSCCVCFVAIFLFLLLGLIVLLGPAEIRGMFANLGWGRKYSPGERTRNDLLRGRASMDCILFRPLGNLSLCYFVGDCWEISGALWP